MVAFLRKELGVTDHVQNFTIIMGQPHRDENSKSIYSRWYLRIIQTRCRPHGPILHNH